MKRFESPLIRLMRLREQLTRMARLHLQQQQSARAALADEVRWRSAGIADERRATVERLQAGCVAAPLQGMLELLTRDVHACEAVRSQLEAATVEVEHSRDAARRRLAEEQVCRRMLAERQHAHDRDDLRREQAILDERAAQRRAGMAAAGETHA